MCSWHPYQRSVDSKCGFILGSLFYGTVLWCLCTSTILFWLYLCNMFWNQEVWGLQFCPFCPRLFWLFKALCGSIWILEFFFFFNFGQKNTLRIFKMHCTESVDCSGSMDILTILSSNPWTWLVFPFICVFFNSFQQYIAVISLFLSLVKFILKQFILLGGIIMEIVFLGSFSD